jgi:peroxiredoxin
LIGVNVNGYDVKELKKAMDKEDLTWRTFADPGELGLGAIATRWNLPGTPTLYVIDHKGVIRHKWVGGPGEKAIDAALDELIKEAEGNKKDPPK